MVTQMAGRPTARHTTVNGADVGATPTPPANLGKENLCRLLIGAVALGLLIGCLICAAWAICVTFMIKAILGG
jgi:hypothetical protein